MRRLDVVHSEDRSHYSMFLARQAWKPLNHVALPHCHGVMVSKFVCLEQLRLGSELGFGFRETAKKEKAYT